MRNHKPRSLTQHFSPPDGFSGSFGWICGYSADDEFLNNAAERFTGQTLAQRAHGGRISLALLLDKGNPQMSPTATPGVFHLLTRTASPPFRLLHAKVAILGFKDKSDARRWSLRLLVSTGNWTQQTVENSLDLVWRIDIGSDEIAKDASDELRTRCADMRAAWAMFTFLKRHHDDSIFEQAPEATFRDKAQFEANLAKVVALGKSAKPRFLDNRSASLLKQLPDKVREIGQAPARNYLGLGSGFWEGAGDGQSMPDAISRIFDTLLENKLITASAERDIFVEPKRCQGIAAGANALNKRDWKIRKAGPGPFKDADRFLHAKFILSGKSGSETFRHGWVYLGSGNLTGPGFVNAMSSGGGNLEAGVVFATGNLYREDARQDPARVLTNLLPVQWKSDLNGNLAILDGGGDWEDRQESYLAAPVSLLQWRAVERSVSDGILSLPQSAQAIDIDVLDPSGAPCPRDSAGQYLWHWGQPRNVEIRWHADGTERRGQVPVLDAFGRLSATPLHTIEVDEAIANLASFPDMPDIDPAEADRDLGEMGTAGTVANPSRGATSHYPVRQMMQLIEEIASRQTAVGKEDWAMWCGRLEQTLFQLSKLAVIQQFRDLKLNPLGPLWHAPFRPVFAETAATSEGTRYEQILLKTEHSWGLEGLTRLGDV